MGLPSQLRSGVFLPVTIMSKKAPPAQKAAPALNNPDGGLRVPDSMSRNAKITIASSGAGST